MTYLIASILLNAVLLIIFRYFKQHDINNLVAIVTNYLVCFGLGVIMTRGESLNVSTIPSDWLPWLLGMGFLFIFTFNIVAITVQAFSVTIATLVQRMSLLLVVIYAVILYQESLTAMKGVGLLMGIASIYLITSPGNSNRQPTDRRLILLPIGLFLLSAIIDICFYEMSQQSITYGQEFAFAGLLFGVAAALGSLFILTFKSHMLHQIKWKDLIAGLVLGIPNLFAVYYLQKMLTTELDGSIAFPIHSIGILLVAALGSYILFKERFSSNKIIGMLTAIAAILLLAHAINFRMDMIKSPGQWDYKTIRLKAQSVFTDRSSKFLGYIYPVHSSEEVKSLLDQLRATHHKAVHWCYAYRLGEEGKDYRSSDDGEPNGTAGLPIYNQLLSADLTQVLMVVVRYYGGTKLGVPGLINAYKTTTQLAIEEATVIIKNIQAIYVVTSVYQYAARLMDNLQSEWSRVRDAKYTNTQVIYRVAIGNERHDTLIRQYIASALDLPSIDALDQVDKSSISWNLLSFEL